MLDVFLKYLYLVLNLMKLPTIILSALLAVAATLPAADKPQPLPERWLHLQANLYPTQNVASTIELIRRVSSEGYNGLMLSDSKFMRWDKLPQLYRDNVREVGEACRAAKVKVIAGVMPIGYSNDLLGRDPNLVEGLPVVDAPFIVRDGKIAPDDTIALANGGLDDFKNHSPAGWEFVDSPGKMSFADTEVKCQGRASLRMQDVAKHEPDHRHARVCQKLKVRPFSYYHVSVAVKTKDWRSSDTRISVLDPDENQLNFQNPEIAVNQDWKTVHIVFNSLKSDTVRLYLGTWAGDTGTIWWDDVRVEPAGLVNVIRRDGTPLCVTSWDRKTTYTETRDFKEIRDPKLGMDPYEGEYTSWHEPPVLALPESSRIKEGERLLISYYHPAIVYSGQMMCCMSEPKVYDILRWQVQQVHKELKPDGYMMHHDEIRSQGWDESCLRRRLSMGQLLAMNVKSCVEIIRKEDPGKPIHVWSDMFDPNHNAKKNGRYYLVKGDGPWHGSWEGLPKDVVIINWNSGPKTRADSMRHFSDRGHSQILAGFYDGPPAAIADWLKAGAGIKGVKGVMYTTWVRDFSQTKAFLDAMR